MTGKINCDKCGRYPIFYRRPYEGIVLCRRCFKDSIERKVRRTISKYKMFSPTDHIGVAVSGGKDSLTLLYILRKIEEGYPEARITALAVDEGIKGYREEALRLAESFTAKIGVNLRTISFKELYGKTMDEMVNALGLRFPCSCCGVLRRKALIELASRIGVDKIATAHNLDDEAQTVILNSDTWRSLKDTHDRAHPRWRRLLHQEGEAALPYTGEGDLSIRVSHGDTFPK
jgi:predicted PP-loop superfamily ATPase